MGAGRYLTIAASHYSMLRSVTTLHSYKCCHSLSNRATSFSGARFSILKIYEREIPFFFAISRCVSSLQTLPSSFLLAELV